MVEVNPLIVLKKSLTVDDECNVIHFVLYFYVKIDYKTDVPESLVEG